jgi:hypothetical protein
MLQMQQLQEMLRVSQMGGASAPMAEYAALTSKNPADPKEPRGKGKGRGRGGDRDTTAAAGAGKAPAQQQQQQQQQLQQQRVEPTPKVCFSGSSRLANF